RGVCGPVDEQGTLAGRQCRPRLGRPVVLGRLRLVRRGLRQRNRAQHGLLHAERTGMGTGRSRGRLRRLGPDRQDCRHATRQPTLTMGTSSSSPPPNRQPPPHLRPPPPLGRTTDPPLDLLTVAAVLL